MLAFRVIGTGLQAAGPRGGDGNPARRVGVPASLRVELVSGRAFSPPVACGKAQAYAKEVV